MSLLIDTDVLSLLERRHVPAKLETWLENNEEPLFVSIVSLAELQYGVNQAPPSHRPRLVAWLDETRRKFAPAIEQLPEAVLVRWQELLSDLKTKNRTMTCEDSLIAATALFHDHTVVTRNKRHFEPANVPVIDPLA